MKRAAALVVASVVIVGAPSARADGASSSPYALSTELDLSVYAVAGTFAAGWLLRHQLAPPPCAPVCDASTLNPLDKLAAGNWSTGWATFSDVGIATLLVGTAATVVATDGVRDAWTDLVVVFESVIVSNALAALSDEAARRPRPFVYGDAAPLSERTDGNAGLSFFSGHSAAAFSATVALASTLHRRDPRGDSWWIALGVGGLASAAIATARVLSGNHFPTDVLAGAAVGSSVGFVVPALHARPIAITPTVSPTAAGLSVALAW